MNAAVCRALIVTTILAAPTAVWGTPQRSLSIAECRCLPRVAANGLEPDVQEPSDQDPRHGFWLGFGAGITSVGFGGDAAAFDIERENGLSIQGRAAYALAPKVSVGVDGLLWIKESEGNTASVWTLMAVATFFPLDQAPLWIEGGAGVLRLDESDIGNVGTGAGFAGAVGYDFALSDNWVAAPFFRVTFSTGVDIEHNGEPAGFTENPQLLTFGVSFIWR